MAINPSILQLESFIQILFFEHLGGRKGEWNLRIALTNFLVMGFISNFITSFNSLVLLKSKRRGLYLQNWRIYGHLNVKIKRGVAGLIIEPSPPNFEKQYNFWRCLSGISTSFKFSKDQCECTLHSEAPPWLIAHN